MTLFFRPLHRQDLDRAGCLDGARYFFSQWEGYWEQSGFDGLRAWLAEHRIPKLSIHTSGHASPVDLKRFVEALSPSKVVPIHSFRPDRYVELFARVEARADGEWWDVGAGNG